ncbi:unnamed protein product [Medioppia subpectinata]|uniref:Uncharacterized protein n=1 Tax=Medioppia subpectinata TaxID=1979941 RepID=A0A7R9PU18_9ACAR|nr:unnamed protein product [Medioppia subpectinata]CAG2101053.1 unnamed protein product [Medioppia subpectinata]
MPIQMTNSLTLVKTILISVIALSIIGSIAQLVAALFAVGASQDVGNLKDQSLMELGAIIMLIMALICFTFELIGILGVLKGNLAVMSVFAVVMTLATIISCFTGSGGLKFLIILLNLTMTALSCIYLYLCVRRKEMEEIRQRNSMSISVINDMNDGLMNNHHNGNSRKISS